MGQHHCQQYWMIREMMQQVGEGGFSAIDVLWPSEGFRKTIPGGIGGETKKMEGQKYHESMLMQPSSPRNVFRRLFPSHSRVYPTWPGLLPLCTDCHGLLYDSARKKI